MACLRVARQLSQAPTASTQCRSVTEITCNYQAVAAGLPDGHDLAVALQGYRTDTRSSVVAEVRSDPGTCPECRIELADGRVPSQGER